jgi:flagellar basal body P-ring formation protein FlgA
MCSSINMLGYLGLMLAVPWASANGFQQIDPATLQRIQRDLQTYINKETANLGGRVEVVFPQQPRLRVPVCDVIEPFVPPGARLWGRANIGLKCKDPMTSWTGYLPIDVRVFVPVITAARTLAGGHPIGENDYEVRELDITREPIGLLTDPASLHDRTTTRSIPAGTALRSEMLRVRPVIASGDLVKVVYMGTGFSIASEGKALSAATLGQPVRVQMESGKIISGMVRNGPLVEMR